MVSHIAKLFEIVKDDSQVVKWIKEFSKVDSSRFAVVKISGASIDKYLDVFSESIGILSKLDLSPPIIYGWGNALTKKLSDMGISSEWHSKTGDRITTPEAMKYVKEISKEYRMKLINSVREKNVNVKFCDDVFKVVPQGWNDVSYEHCNGKITEVNKRIICELTEKGIVPIISPIGKYKRKFLNVNADSAGHALVDALHPLKYCQVTNTGGILDREGKVISRISIKDNLDLLLKSKIVSGGMEKKLLEARDLLLKIPSNDISHSVQIVHPKNLIQELFSDYGKGTYITL